MSITAKSALNHFQKLGQDMQQNEEGKSVFRGHHVLTGQNNIGTIKEKYVSNSLVNLEARLPQEDSNIMEAFQHSWPLPPVHFESNGKS